MRWGWGVGAELIRKSGEMNLCCYCGHGTTHKPVLRWLVTGLLTNQVDLPLPPTLFIFMQCPVPSACRAGKKEMTAGQETATAFWVRSWLGEGPDCQGTRSDVRAQHNQKTPANQATKDLAETPRSESPRLLFPPPTPFLL